MPPDWAMMPAAPLADPAYAPVVPSSPRRPLSAAARNPVRSAGGAGRRPQPARPLVADRLRPLPARPAARAGQLAGAHRRYRRCEPRHDRPVAVAAHDRGAAGRPPGRCRRRGRRLRHRFRRARPDLAQDAAAAAGAERGRHGRCRKAAVGPARSRPGSGGGDAQSAGGARLYPDRPRRGAGAGAEGGLCLCRRRPARPCRQFHPGCAEPAGVRGGGRRGRIFEPASRVGPCGAPACR